MGPGFRVFRTPQPWSAHPRTGRQAGLEISPHILRHTFATNLVRRGEDLVIVAELLGHSRVETVRVYTLPTEEQVQAAVDGAVIDY